jgi:hypothetical protein
MVDKLANLAAELEALPPWQKLLVASELLQRGPCADLAITIAECVVLEYRAAQLLKQNGPK